MLHFLDIIRYRELDADKNIHKKIGGLGNVGLPMNKIKSIDVLILRLGSRLLILKL
jgi:hypothetical protein